MILRRCPQRNNGQQRCQQDMTDDFHDCKGNTLQKVYQTLWGPPGVADKCLIISKILIILGSICAEDFRESIDNQYVIDHWPIQTCTTDHTDLLQSPY